MANINVNYLIDLNLAGADLFNDPESFMKDLNEESEQVIGGETKPVCAPPTCVQSKTDCNYNSRIRVEHFAQPVQALQELGTFILQP
ncbi:hypothetical protein Q5692_27785 [Microcoleus sp. C2C3]|uniref:hypothetical protein n=1 Tax=unclassified Microcoleus TaxID=2642155 RepID=UPI002FD4C049